MGDGGWEGGGWGVGRVPNGSSGEDIGRKHKEEALVNVKLSPCQ